MESKAIARLHVGAPVSHKVNSWPTDPAVLGPVVQSIVSLTSFLRCQLVKCLNFITQITDIFC